MPTRPNFRRFFLLSYQRVLNFLKMYNFKESYLKFLSNFWKKNSQFFDFFLNFFDDISWFLFFIQRIIQPLENHKIIHKFSVEKLIKANQQNPKKSIFILP